MAVREDAPPPGWEAYTGDPETAGPFENQILYAMCRDNPANDDPYVTAGKITAIGRIYAAAPERGAGYGRETDSLAYAIGVRLANCALDEQLEAIGFAERFSQSTRAQVVEAHSLLVAETAIATRGWSTAADDETWFPRNQASFASKYLHFHRPNSFPIMDSYARAGLACAGVSGRFNTYERFCAAMARHVDGQGPGWTPRSVDSDLVNRGRIHLDRAGLRCRRCKAEFIKRPRQKKLMKMNGD